MSWNVLYPRGPLRCCADMGRMKTTVEISDALAREAREIARHEKTTLRELIKMGLRAVLRERRRKVGFRLRDASFGGNGLEAEFRRGLGAPARGGVRGTRNVIAVDTNILVYAHRRDAEWHDRAAARLQSLAEGRTSWAIPWPCVHEFLAIVTHARVYDPRTPVARALDQVEASGAAFPPR